MCEIGPDTGASHIGNTGNQNVMITLMKGNFAVGLKQSGSEQKWGNKQAPSDPSARPSCVC